MKKMTPHLKEVYGSDPDTLDHQKKRYGRIDREFVRLFGDRPRGCVSVPGRTEICGNHTDHNHGRVLAAAIDLDMAAVAGANDTMTVTLHSEGYERPFVVFLTDLSVRGEEKGTTEAMIRGIAARMEESGYAIGGFDAFLESEVMPGSGLSSSAAVEVLIGTVFNALFNEGRISPEEIAKIGQYAENVYFGKPCGLMDQMACAVGGIVAMDFKDPENPGITRLSFDFKAHGYDLLIVDTNASHLDLTDDYAAVPAEMKTVARALGAHTMREVSPERFFGEISRLRTVAGDRAVLRAMHFLEEDQRVVRQVDALTRNDTGAFIRLVRESGESSFKQLQNIYSPRNVHSQGMTLALALTERFLFKLKDGACRVHGGGFAGAVQVFLPVSATDEYIHYIKEVFGTKHVVLLGARPVGAAFARRLQ